MHQYTQLQMSTNINSMNVIIGLCHSLNGKVGTQLSHQGSCQRKPDEVDVTEVYESLPFKHQRL